MASTGSNALAQIHHHVYFNDVESGLRNEELVFRLIHFWEARNPTKGGILIGLKLRFIDEHGTVIQGFIAPNRMARYEALRKRNSIYRLTNFYATNNKVMFRVTEHKFTLCFTDLTTLTEVDQEAYSIDDQRFRFYSFPEFEAKADRRGDLYDVIGHLKLINGQNLHHRPVLNNDSGNSDGKKDRLSVHLQLRQGPVVNMYLWDNAASEFLKKFQASTTTPTVLLVTTVNPKRNGARVTLSSMSPSRVFFDLDVVHTSEYLTWLGDNATSLVTVNTSQVTKLETLTIAEILQFLRNEAAQVASFNCVATIADVVRQSGWYYISSIACNKKLIRGATSLVCNICKNKNAIGVIKYRVEISVHDNVDKATFVLLDDAATQIAGRSATEIIDNSNHGNGDMDAGHEFPIPQCLFDSIGQTHKFEVKVTAYNFRATRQTITVSKILEAAELPQPTSQNVTLDIVEENVEQNLAAGDNNASKRNKNTTATDIKSSDGNNNCEAITVETITTDCNMKTNTTVAETSTSGSEKFVKISVEAIKSPESSRNSKDNVGDTKTKRARLNT